MKFRSHAAVVVAISYSGQSKRDHISPGRHAWRSITIAPA
jgi:hypothetical protein